MITFHSENISFKLAQKLLLKRWIKSVVANEGKTLGDIAYIFCCDDYLLSVNQTYLNHDYYTDVITFDYSESGVVSGDVFISVDTVRLNASEYGSSFEQELYRVMIHGVLHLCGYLDASKAQQLAMRKKEDECLKILHDLLAEV